MTDREAFIRRICEEPGCDAHRLVYADWLEEHGGDPERAAFIRLQCEISHLGKPPDDVAKEFDRLMDRWGSGLPLPKCDRSWAGKLLREQMMWSAKSPGSQFTNYATWFEPFRRACIPEGGLPWVFSRGFVSEIRMPADAFMSHAEELFRAHPVTAVTLADKEPLRWTPDAGSGSSDPDDRFLWIDGFRSRRTRTADRMAASLPGELFEELKKLPNAIVWHNESVWYDTRELALEDLSRACVALGRKKAGLPALPAPSPQEAP